MAVINPYLNFQGNTEEVFIFYKSVFGGEFVNVSRFRDTPEGPSLPPGDQDKIMHIALPIARGNVLMGTDILESAGQKMNAGNNFSLAVGADSEAEADRIFNGLSAGGTIALPMQKTFWGAYFGMATDKFGIKWMVSYDEVNTPSK